MADNYEIYEYEDGFKRVLKNGKAINEFGLLKDVQKLQAENAELSGKLGLCVNHLLLALNLDEIEDEEDKASIHAKANDFIVECDGKLKGL